MKKNFMFFLSIMIILSWIITAGHYIYKNFWPITIIEHHFDEAEVINPNKQVKRGGVLQFHYLYSKYVDISGTVSRMLVNDRLLPLSLEECAVLPVGKNQKKIISVNIPENMFPGWYYITNTIKYPICDDRIITVTYRTEWFEVLP